MSCVSPSVSPVKVTDKNLVLSSFLTRKNVKVPYKNLEWDFQTYLIQYFWLIQVIAIVLFNHIYNFPTALWITEL